MTILDATFATAGDLDEPGTDKSALSVFDAAAVVVAAAMVLFCMPGGWSPFLTPRIAVLAALVPVGLILLVGMVARRDAAALFGCALLVWAVVSAIASSAPGASLLGTIDGNQSVLMLAGSMSA